MRNTNTDQPGHPGDVRVQEFLDMIAPSVIKFNTSLILYKVNLGERVFLNGTALFTFIFAHWWLIILIKNFQMKIEN